MLCSASLIGPAGLALLSLWASLATAVSFPKIPNTLGTHDPSRLIQDGDCFYFYSTSNDLSGWFTCDEGDSWKQTPAVFPNGIPISVHQHAPTNDGHNIWAPDVIYNTYTNLFYLYYAVADWDNSLQNAIGLVTSPTLDPSQAKWTDRGVVIYRSTKSDQYAAIDPGPFFDDNGDLWLTLGSGYAVTRATAINVIPLDRETGLRSGSNITSVQSCGCEASYIQPHSGSYYLFWNTGGCCSGATSTYTIHVAKGSSPTGPFGTPSTFLSSSSTEHGPGQIGITTENDVDYFTYHYYPNEGGSVLGYGEVDWSSGMPKAKESASDTSKLC